MGTILVEACQDPSPSAVLDVIAAPCRGPGHDEFCLPQPQSGREPYWRHHFRSDLAIDWDRRWDGDELVCELLATLARRIRWLLVG
jgi:hypothetical protein